MKIVYKIKHLLSKEEVELIKEKLRIFFKLEDGCVLVICDDNFEYSDLIIINENTISK